jgi:type IV pilus assembly protein PilM
MAKQQVSVFIDDASVSVLVTKGRQAEKWTTVPLEPGLVKEGVVQDQPAVAEKIKQAWHESKIMRRRVAVGVSGLNCLYQMMLLPELAETLREEAISREAAQSLGIPLDGVYLSWQVLSIDHGQMKVYLAVLPKDKVDSVAETLKLANLRPMIMDIKPLCLARAASEPRAIMVDTTQDSLDIVVLGDGVPEVVRSLQLAPATPAGERIGILRSEMERSISFYNAAHLDKPIDLTVPVLVSGDLVGQEGEMTSLAGPRERPVRALESPLVGTEGFEHGKYMPCIGLAIKGILASGPGALSNSVVNFDALPEKYRIKKQSLADVMWIPSVLIGVVVIGMGIWGITYLKGENSDLQGQRDSINGTIAEQKVSDKDVKALQEQVDAAKAPAAALDQLLDNLGAGRLTMADDLSLITGCAAESGVVLESVSYQMDKASISGTAGTADEVFQYGWLLKDRGGFSSVAIPSVSDSGAGVDFRMELTA